MKYNNIHLLFEQSGTFKNEFKKLGFKNSYDYDILNDFGELTFKLNYLMKLKRLTREREREYI